MSNDQKLGGQDFLYWKEPNDSNLTRVLQGLNESTGHREMYSKKNGEGDKTSPSPPETGPLSRLVLIEQLEPYGCLIGIGVARPSLINGSIGPVLPEFRSPDEHFGELVGSR